MRLLTRRRATALVAAGALTALAATGAAADDVSTSTVTQAVQPGALTASLDDLGLDAASYSHVDQQTNGEVTLSVDDSSATGAGWNVTIEASALAYSGDNDGDDIDASNLRLASAAAPSLVAGQAIDPESGPRVPANLELSGLDEARVVIVSDAGQGQGAYAQELGLELTVPGQARSGTYTGTVTTTATAGPTN